MVIVWPARRADWASGSRRRDRCRDCQGIRRERDGIYGWDILHIRHLYYLGDSLLLLSSPLFWSYINHSFLSKCLISLLHLSSANLLLCQSFSLLLWRAKIGACRRAALFGWSWLASIRKHCPRGCNGASGVLSEILFGLARLPNCMPRFPMSLVLRTVVLSDETGLSIPSLEVYIINPSYLWRCHLVSLHAPSSASLLTSALPCPASCQAGRAVKCRIRPLIRPILLQTYLIGLFLARPTTHNVSTPERSSLGKILDNLSLAAQWLSGLGIILQLLRYIRIHLWDDNPGVLLCAPLVPDMVRAEQYWLSNP